ncbi:helix-turn-helix transcriptional regulator [Streptomyces sp. JJ66]|nr:helix-turn-helix transcriptional regulator [Streptomyces sp. JJ66]
MAATGAGGTLRPHGPGPEGDAAQAHGGSDGGAPATAGSPVAGSAGSGLAGADPGAAGARAEAAGVLAEAVGASTGTGRAAAEKGADAKAVGPGADAAQAASANGFGGAGRPTRLRVDAQRNLEHVLRAAREVFGELGYGAPMEDVARRARVGVGTVYRRFPSKEVLVRRIAREETERLTQQARTALRQEGEPWSALARFLRASATSGAGRLLPPEVLRADAGPEGGSADGTNSAEPRVPQQRQPSGTAPTGLWPYGDAAAPGEGIPDRGAQGGPVSPGPAGAGPVEPGAVEPGSAELLGVVGELVRRARNDGALRPSVTVGDVLLVIATSAPALPDAEQQRQASYRLLDILLEGLRARPEH